MNIENETGQGGERERDRDESKQTGQGNKTTGGNRDDNRSAQQTGSTRNANNPGGSKQGRDDQSQNPPRTPTGQQSNPNDATESDEVRRGRQQQGQKGDPNANNPGSGSR